MEPLSLCVTSNVHVPTGDYGVYQDFEEEAKAHSDNRNQGEKKILRPINQTKSKLANMLVRNVRERRTIGYARERMTIGQARERRTIRHTWERTTIGHARARRIIGHARERRTIRHTWELMTIGHARERRTIGTRKGAKDKAISSHDGSHNLSMSSMTTSGTVIPGVQSHSTSMGSHWRTKVDQYEKPKRLPVTLY
eukprot:TRINITY_DN5223_c0_g1_i1.p1 TRINITY_DN5223_c0_g1~~TRINITY_DN5223_c0_g1_i1.p1  ORF type:complete len:196 (-),score=17.15 TRINITY_DN5223_c0_g1_i1:49-636(-)